MPIRAALSRFPLLWAYLEAEAPPGVDAMRVELVEAVLAIGRLRWDLSRPCSRCQGATLHLPTDALQKPGPK